MDYLTFPVATDGSSCLSLPLLHVKTGQPMSPSGAANVT